MNKVHEGSGFTTGKGVLGSTRSPCERKKSGGELGRRTGIQLRRRKEQS